MPSKESTTSALIASWDTYQGGIAAPARYLTLMRDLYNVRNSVPGYSYPAYLIDPDDEIMAAVEHYFLCRAWVGNGVQPAWQMRAMKGIYNTGKKLGVTPRHNPAKAPTPPSALQTLFQDRGIVDGEADLKSSGGSAPLIAKPATY